MRQLIGVGYRSQLAGWINSRPAEMSCLEITAEHFFDDRTTLHKLAQHYPILVHGLGLSLGTPGALDKEYLQQFAAVVQAADPLWISEHIAFTRAGGVDLGHLNPIACTEDALANLVEHAQQVMAACHKPLLLENITTHLQVPGSIAETDFINRLCEQSGCGMLLDVTNLYVNSRNHGFDALQWLHEIEPHYIRQLHLVGYNKQGDTWYDSHAENIQQELYELTRTVMAYSNVEAIIIERDNNFPTTQQMQQELCNLEQCCIANQLH